MPTPPCNAFGAAKPSGGVACSHGQHPRFELVPVVQDMFEEEFLQSVPLKRRAIESGVESTHQNRLVLSRFDKARLRVVVTTQGASHDDQDIRLRPNSTKQKEGLDLRVQLTSPILELRERSRSSDALSTVNRL